MSILVCFNANLKANSLDDGRCGYSSFRLGKIMGYAGSRASQFAGVHLKSFIIWYIMSMGMEDYPLVN